LSGQGFSVPRLPRFRLFPAAKPWNDKTYICEHAELGGETVELGHFRLSVYFFFPNNILEEEIEQKRKTALWRFKAKPWNFSAKVGEHSS